MVCPRCGHGDLNQIRINREGKLHRGPPDSFYIWPSDLNRKKTYFEVAQCLRCGWRAETPWEAGKRMAQESLRRIGLKWDS